MSEAHRTPDYVSEHSKGALVHVYVQPKAGTQGVVGLHGGALKVKVTAPPLDDRANGAVAALLAEVLGVPVRDVSLVGGRTARNKRFVVASLSSEGVASALERVLSSRAP
jgi:uncharacterized protein